MSEIIVGARFAEKFWRARGVKHRAAATGGRANARLSAATTAAAKPLCCGLWPDCCGRNRSANGDFAAARKRRKFAESPARHCCIKRRIFFPARLPTISPLPATATDNGRPRRWNGRDCRRWRRTRRRLFRAECVSDCRWRECARRPPEVVPGWTSPKRIWTKAAAAWSPTLSPPPSPKMPPS